MDNSELLSYAYVPVIIMITIVFFIYYSVRYKNFRKLFPLVLISVWVIIAVFKGFEYLYFHDSYILFSSDGYMGLLAETLPMTVIIGGITFFIKYRKMRRKNFL